MAISSRSCFGTWLQVFHCNPTQPTHAEFESSLRIGSRNSWSILVRLSSSNEREQKSVSLWHYWHFQTNTYWCVWCWEKIWSSRIDTSELRILIENFQTGIVLHSWDRTWDCTIMFLRAFSTPFRRCRKSSRPNCLPLLFCRGANFRFGDKESLNSRFYVICVVVVPIWALVRTIF